MSMFANMLTASDIGNAPADDGDAVFVAPASDINPAIRSSPTFGRPEGASSCDCW
jgi:hypothetical protein